MEETKKEKERPLYQMSETEMKEKIHAATIQPESPEMLKSRERIAWQQRKETHVDSLTPDELKRVLAEKEEARVRREKDARETEAAIKEREKKFLDELIADCTTGDPETRFAKFLVRASMKGVFGLNPMQDPRDKTRVLTELLRFHNIQVRDGKEKPSRNDFERSVMFVSDPFVRKGDVVLTRRSLFPSEPSDAV